jgi:transposase
MITIPSNIEIFVAIEAIDFRNGVNGLGRICREMMKKDPMKGAMFVFRNKRKTSLKILFYDGEAFWLFMRRLSSGKIQWWPKSNQGFTEMESKKLQMLIMNGNPEAAEFGQDWKKIL